MAVNRIAYLIAGAALGAAGMALAKEGKGENLVQNLVHGGHGLVEKMLGSVETLKEDIEDYLAEAQYAHEEKMRDTAAAAAPSAKTTATEKAAPKKRVGRPAAKKAATAKTTAKKPAVKKTSTKKPAVKKPATKKTAAKKTVAQKATPKKTTVSKGDQDPSVETPKA